MPVDFETFWRTSMASRVFDRMKWYARSESDTSYLLACFMQSRDENWAFELFHSKRVYSCLSQYFDGTKLAIAYDREMAYEQEMRDAA